METLLRKLWDALRNEPRERDRRRVALRQALQYDSLEGRQLLSGLGGMATAQHAALVRHPHGHAAARSHGRLRPGAAMGPWQNGAAGATAPASTMTSMAAPTPPQTETGGGVTAPAASPVQTWGALTTNGQPGTQASTLPDLQAAPPPGSTTTTATATAQAPPGQQPPAPPSNPALTAALETLRTDIHAIMAKSQVTVAQTVALQDDLQAIGKASTSAPSQETLQAFQKDVAAIQGTLPTDAQKAQLEADFTAMVKSRGVADSSLIDKAIGDAEAIFASSQVTGDDLSRIDTDQKAVQAALGSSDPGNPTLGKFGNLGLGSAFDALMGSGGFDAWQIGMPTGTPSLWNQGGMPNGTMPGQMAVSTGKMGVTTGQVTGGTTGQATATTTPANTMFFGGNGPMGGHITMWTALRGTMPGGGGMVSATNAGPGMGMPMGKMASMGGPMIPAPGTSTVPAGNDAGTTTTSDSNGGDTKGA